MTTIDPALLFEISAEVCYKMGGIHTVIKSKARYTQELWKDQYFLLGAYMGAHQYSPEVFEPLDVAMLPNEMVKKAVEAFNAQGFFVHTGIWKIEGNPWVLLLDPMQISGHFDGFRRDFQDNYPELVPINFMVEAYLRFGCALFYFFDTLQKIAPPALKPRVLAHFHEYMVAVSLQKIKQLGVQTIFTTHSTTAGRFMLANDPALFKAILLEEKKYDSTLPSGYLRFCEHVELQATQQAQVFTTVSKVMAEECQHFLGRYPDYITPNGLNLAAIEAPDEASKMEIREQIDKVVNKHFFSDPLLAAHSRKYFVSSGRYEYVAKGYDVTVEALAKLNDWLKSEQLETTVIMFFITDAPWTAGSFLINQLRYWSLRFASWFRQPETSIFLHQVPRRFHDNLLVKNLFAQKLRNQPDQRVKVVYYPQFLSPQGPVFKMDYLDFVAACDLGVFPSLYEPWGYTPMECILVGTPAIASNTSGFVDFVEEHTDINEDRGLFVIDRKKDLSVDELFVAMKKYLLKDQAFQAPETTQLEQFDWSKMIFAYDRAYQHVLHLSNLKTL